MSVVIETTLGDITVDLFLLQRPRACLNFLKLCKKKYYNYNLFHTISRGFIAQTGDPTGSRSGGESIFGILEGESKRFFEGENEPRIKHTKMGLISFVGNEERMIGSQFFITLGEDITYLDEKHCVFGEVVEGYDILEVINEVICDTDDRPYQDVRITHTVILDDPYPDPKTLRVPSRSPSPSAERLQGGRIAPDEDVDETEGKNVREIAEMQAEREAKARATILEMVGDLPDAEMAPPENVLFVCKLNPVTTDDDLEIIFNRFGKIKSCEVIRDRKTNDSLQYAFIEFEDEKSCEDAYFKMDNILIDDRRIHVDFSQSVSKIKWHGKGRGVTHYDDKGKRTKDNNNGIGRGDYKVYSSEKDLSRNNNSRNSKNSGRNKRDKSYSKSPTRNTDKSELLSKKTEKDNQRMQSKTLRRISRSRSRSPRRRFNSRSPDRRNDRKVSPRRKDTPSAYGRNRSDRRITTYRRTRDWSRSPTSSSLTRRYTNENRRHKTSSRSNHERYSRSESRQESSIHFTREEITQSEKRHYSDRKERYINKSKENSHKKGIYSSDDSEAENNNKINKEPNPRRNYSKTEVERKAKNIKEIESSRDSQSKNNKNDKKQKHRKNSSKSEEKTRKRKKKSKESSSDSSSDSSSSESSSDSSTSDSSDSSSESDSSDSEIERRKKGKSKKRSKKTTDESSDSDSSTRNKPKKKRKKPQSSDSDSDEGTRKKTKKSKKKS